MAGTETSAIIEDLGYGTWHLAIVAKDAAGNLSQTMTTLDLILSDTVAPTWPMPFQSEDVHATWVDLSWSAAADNVGVDHYELWQDGTLIASLGSTVTSYRVESLQVGAFVDFALRAKDVAQNQSATGPTWGVVTRDSDPPQTVSGSILSATLDGYGLVVDWSQATWTDDQGVTGYVISVFANGYWTSTSASVPTTSVFFDSLWAPTYAVTVVAQDAAGGFSSPVIASINLVAETTPPTWDSGTEFTAVPTSPVSGHLSWWSAYDASGVVAYRILEGGQPRIEVSAVALGSQTDIWGLVPGTVYTYQLEAIDFWGNTATFPTEFTFTTPELPFCYPGWTNCCHNHAECSDSDPATIDLCEGTVCVHHPDLLYCDAATSCDDGDPCTFDTCLDSKCINAEYAYCCSDPGGCSISTQQLLLGSDWSILLDDAGRLRRAVGGELNLAGAANAVVDVQNVEALVRQVVRDNEATLGIDERWFRVVNVSDLGQGPGDLLVVTFVQEYAGMTVEGGNLRAQVVAGSLIGLLAQYRTGFVVDPDLAVSRASAEERAMTLAGLDPQVAQARGYHAIVRAGATPRVSWSGVVGLGESYQRVDVSAADVHDARIVRTAVDDSPPATGTPISTRIRGWMGPVGGEPFVNGMVAVSVGLSTEFAMLDHQGVATLSLPFSSKGLYSVKAGLFGRFASVRSAAANPECPDVGWRLALCQTSLLFAPFCGSLVDSCALAKNMTIQSGNPILPPGAPHPLLEANFQLPNTSEDYVAGAGGSTELVAPINVSWAGSASGPGNAFPINPPFDGSTGRTHSRAYMAVNAAHAFFNNDCANADFVRNPTGNDDEVLGAPAPPVVGGDGCEFLGIGYADLSAPFHTPKSWASVPVVMSLPGTNSSGTCGGYDPFRFGYDWTPDFGVSLGSQPEPLGDFGAILIHQTSPSPIPDPLGENSALPCESTTVDVEHTIYHEYGHLIDDIYSHVPVATELAGAPATPASGIAELFAEWFADVIAGGGQAAVLDDLQFYPQRDACYERDVRLFPEEDGSIGPHSHGLALETIASDIVENLRIDPGMTLRDSVKLASKLMMYAIAFDPADQFELLEAVLWGDQLIQPDIDILAPGPHWLQICNAFNHHGVTVKRCFGHTTEPAFLVDSPLPKDSFYNPYPPDANPTVVVPPVLVPLAIGTHPQQVPLKITLAPCAGATSVDVSVGMRPRIPPGACADTSVSMCGGCNFVHCPGLNVDFTTQHLLNAGAPINVPVGDPIINQPLGQVAVDIGGSAPAFNRIPNGIWELGFSFICHFPDGTSSARPGRNAFIVVDDKFYDFAIREPITVSSSFEVSDPNGDGVFQIDFRGGQLLCTPGTTFTGHGWSPTEIGSPPVGYDDGVGAIVREFEGESPPVPAGSSSVNSGRPTVHACTFDNYTTGIRVAVAQEPNQSAPMAERFGAFVEDNTIRNLRGHAKEEAADCYGRPVRGVHILPSAGYPVAVRGNSVAGISGVSGLQAVGIYSQGSRPGFVAIDNTIANPPPGIDPQSGAIDASGNQNQAGIQADNATPPQTIFDNVIQHVGHDPADFGIRLHLGKASSKLSAVDDNEITGGRGIAVDGALTGSPASVTISNNKLTQLAHQSGSKPAIRVVGDLQGSVLVADNSFADTDLAIQVRKSAGTVLEGNHVTSPIHGAFLDARDVGNRPVFEGTDLTRTTAAFRIVNNDAVGSVGGSPAAGATAGLQIYGAAGDLEIRLNNLHTSDDGSHVTTGDACLAPFACPAPADVCWLANALIADAGRGVLVEKDGTDQYPTDVRFGEPQYSTQQVIRGANSAVVLDGVGLASFQGFHGLHSEGLPTAGGQHLAALDINSAAYLDISGAWAAYGQTILMVPDSTQIVAEAGDCLNGTAVEQAKIWTTRCTTAASGLLLAGITESAEFSQVRVVPNDAEISQGIVVAGAQGATNFDVAIESSKVGAFSAFFGAAISILGAGNQLRITDTVAGPPGPYATAGIRTAPFRAIDISGVTLGFRADDCTPQEVNAGVPRCELPIWSGSSSSAVGIGVEIHAAGGDPYLLSGCPNSAPECTRSVTDSRIEGFDVGVVVNSVGHVSLRDLSIGARAAGILGAFAHELGVYESTIWTLLESAGADLAPYDAIIAAIAISGTATAGVVVFGNVVRDATSSGEGTPWRGLFLAGLNGAVVSQNVVEASRREVIKLAATVGGDVVGNLFGESTELLGSQPVYLDDGSGTNWSEAPTWDPQSLQGSCSGGNYYAAPMTSAFANLFPSAGCIDPATSQPPTPHPFGTPVNIPGSAASIDFYPLVETGP